MQCAAEAIVDQLKTEMDPNLLKTRVLEQINKNPATMNAGKLDENRLDVSNSATFVSNNLPLQLPKPLAVPAKQLPIQAMQMLRQARQLSAQQFNQPSNQLLLPQTQLKLLPVQLKQTPAQPNLPSAQPKHVSFAPNLPSVQPKHVSFELNPPSTLHKQAVVALSNQPAAPFKQAQAQLNQPSYQLYQTSAQLSQPSAQPKQVSAQLNLPSAQLKQISAQLNQPPYQLYQTSAQLNQPSFPLRQTPAQPRLPSFQLRQSPAEPSLPLVQLRQTPAQQSLPLVQYRQILPVQLRQVPVQIRQVQLQIKQVPVHLKQPAVQLRQVVAQTKPPPVPAKLILPPSILPVHISMALQAAHQPPALPGPSPPAVSAPKPPSPELPALSPPKTPSPPSTPPTSTPLQRSSEGLPTTPTKYSFATAVCGKAKDKQMPVGTENTTLCKGNFGDDAGFMVETSDEFLLGVADGAGGNAALGINPALFPSALMQHCVDVIRRGAFLHRDPRALLQQAFTSMETKEVYGSSTVCLVSLDKYRCDLLTTNLGDSGFVVVRAQQVYARSQPMKYNGDRPKQLDFWPWSIQLKRMGIPVSGDQPKDAACRRVTLMPGDVVVLSTDGLFDNLDEQDIAKVVSGALPSGSAAVARALVDECEKVNKKQDDILVIVGTVISGAEKRLESTSNSMSQ